jgi:glycosyltransferase involved in cell wall biosynthesis
MQSPLISVVIPTYNRAKLLERAVRSVLSQSFQQFELLIVDDNSPDNTEEVVKSFDDERIRYLRHDTNRGAAASRNSGICNARAEFIAFLDDDDDYLPGALAESYNVIQGLPESVGYVIGGILLVNDTPQGEEVLEERLPNIPPFKSLEQSYLSFLRQVPFGSGYGVTFRRSAFDTVGLFDEKLCAAEDRDLFIRFARHFECIVIPKMLVRVHKHVGAQLTDPSPKRVLPYEQIAAKHLDTLQSHPKYYRDVLFTIGLKYYRCGAKMQGRRAFAQSLTKDPMQAKVWLNFLSFELFNMDSFQLRQQLRQAVGGMRASSNAKHEIVEM